MQLQCPTCGAMFDRTVRRDEPSWEMRQTTEIVFGSQPYLVCEAGHQWTIKTLWRRENEWDEVLLDRLIGQEVP